MFNLHRLLLLGLCCTLPLSFNLNAAEVVASEDDNMVTLFGIKLPKEAPKNLREDQVAAWVKQNSKIMELRDKVTDAFSQVRTAASEENEKKRQKKLEDAIKKLEKAEKGFYREAKGILDKVNKKYLPLKAKKEKLEKEIEKAEDRNDDKTATKLSQELQKFSSQFEGFERLLSIAYSKLILEENAELLTIAEQNNIKIDWLPEELAAAADGEPKADKKTKKGKTEGEGEGDRKGKKRAGKQIRGARGAEE